MSSACFFFSIHEPFFLRRYNVFDLGQNSLYEDDEKNCDHIRRVASECYLPTIDTFLRQIEATKGDFKISCLVSLPALDLFEQYAPEVVDGIKALADTKCVEFVAGAAHSLAFLYSKDEFSRQLQFYKSRISKLCNQVPTCFCSTELIYNNDFASFLESEGCKVMLGEGTDHVLGWRSPNYVYRPVSSDKMRLLLRNRKMSRDLSFRFRDKTWDKWPLTADTFAEWCREVGERNDILNIFTNMNIFGIINRPETGIFEFLNSLPFEMLKRKISFVTPTEAAEKFEARDTIDIREFVSWDDAGGDLNSWLGNDMQKDAVHFLYSMADAVHELNDSRYSREFARLQSSDYLRWMSTKWFSNYLQNNSPFSNPQDAYIIYMNILADFEIRLERALEEKQNALARASQDTSSDRSSGKLVA